MFDLGMVNELSVFELLKFYFRLQLEYSAAI